MSHDATLDRLAEDGLQDAEKKRRWLKRQVRQGKLPRFVFARGKDLELERRPQRGYPKGKLTWRMISIYEAIG